MSAAILWFCTLAACFGGLLLGLAAAWVGAGAWDCAAAGGAEAFSEPAEGWPCLPAAGLPAPPCRHTNRVMRAPARQGVNFADQSVSCRAAFPDSWRGETPAAASSACPLKRCIKSRLGVVRQVSVGCCRHATFVFCFTGIPADCWPGTY